MSVLRVCQDATRCIGETRLVTPRVEHVLPTCNLSTIAVDDKKKNSQFVRHAEFDIPRGVRRYPRKVDV